MKVFILLCFIGAALASRECPENQHYDSCGTACPLTCKNYKNPPKVCVLMCVPGCHCDAGYVKSSDGRCVRPEECPSEARPVEKSCLAKPDPGMCYAYIPMWYYDPKTMSCHKFVYGGCQGNGNRYATQEECEENCRGVVQESTNPICELPAETGVCRAFFPRFFFDKLTGACQKFVYGGCGGNENNFETEEECRRTCGDSVLPALDRPDCDQGPQPGPCKGYMPRYYYDQGEGMCKKFIYGGCGGNRNNFETEQDCYNKCGALAAPSACKQEKAVGPCKAYFPRYFFNKESGKCEHFVYGGCQGNSNNFESLEDCEAVCVSLAAPSACKLEKEVGPCKAYFPRYFFNKQSGKCEHFIYGGCQGNSNNFESLEDCESVCVS